MAYFDIEKNVDAYVEMAFGHDGRELVDDLCRYLPQGASVLEIGMGPGKDLDLLAVQFDATGSDASSLFVERRLASDPLADVLVLDAVTLETPRRFDAIYSNKVLQHLTPEEVARSLAAQWEILRPGGVALHGIWAGEGVEFYDDLRFQRYTQATLEELLQSRFELLEARAYEELEPNDSLVVVLRRVDGS